MNPNACSGSTASPARTRPRLFGGSLSLHGACGSRAGAESTPRVPRSSDHPCASLHRDRLVGPTAGLTAPSARTHATAPRESSRLGPARSSAGGTPADTKVGSCLAASSPSWYLLPKGVRSPRKRVNSTANPNVVPGFLAVPCDTPYCYPSAERSHIDLYIYRPTTTHTPGTPFYDPVFTG